MTTIRVKEKMHEDLPPLDIIFPLFTIELTSYFLVFLQTGKKN